MNRWDLIRKQIERSDETLSKYRYLIALNVIVVYAGGLVGLPVSISAFRDMGRDWLYSERAARRDQWRVRTSET